MTTTVQALIKSPGEVYLPHPWIKTDFNSPRRPWKSPGSSLYLFGQGEMIYFLSNRRIKGKWWHFCIFSSLSHLYITCFPPPSCLCTRSSIIQWFLITFVLNSSSNPLLNWTFHFFNVCFLSGSIRLIISGKASGKWSIPWICLGVLRVALEPYYKWYFVSISAIWKNK